MSEFLSQSQFGETSPEIQARTLWLHKDAQTILGKIKEGFGVNSEKYTQALRSYDQLEKAFYAAVESERKITKDEIQAISAENYGELRKIENEIPETKSTHSPGSERINFSNLGGDMPGSKVEKIDITKTPVQILEDSIGKVLGLTRENDGSFIIKPSILLEKIQSLSLPKLNELKNIFGEFKVTNGTCPFLFKTSSLEVLLKLTHLQIIEKQKANLSKKLKDYLVLKGIPEEKQQEIITKILSLNLENINGSNALCTADWMKQIVKILKDYGVENIGYADKNNLLDFIESNLKITKEKYNGELFDLFSSQEKLGLLQELQNEKDSKIIEKKLQENDFSPEEILKIQNLLGGEEKYAQAKENLEELKHSNKEEFERFLHDVQSGKSGQESMKSLLHTKEERELKESGMLPSTTELFVLGEEKVPFYVKNTSFFLQTHIGEIAISREEFKIVENNPEALKNLIDFKSILHELGINKLWDFRKNIFTALENKSGNSFDSENNFLGESEVVNFLNHTLLAVGVEEKISQNTSLDVIKQEFKIKNQVGAILTGGINQINGNTSIEQAFVNNFCPIENNGKFENSKFCEAIA